MDYFDSPDEKSGQGGKTLVRFLFLLLFVVGGCSAGIPRANDSGKTPVQPSLVAYSPRSNCIMDKMQEAKDGWQHVVRSEDLALFPPSKIAECGEDGETSERRFGIKKGHAQRFVLYGDPNRTYCVGVERISGYITLSHFRGNVNRNGDMFTWCLVTQIDHPATVAVQSLTPDSVFRLILF